jgi:predicted metal-dependent phosphoesterase TrpH
MMDLIIIQGLVLFVTNIKQMGIQHLQLCDHQTTEQMNEVQN